jgi:hypothetical protein
MFKDVNYTEHEICSEVRHIDLDGGVIKYSMILKKGSYLKDYFNARLRL